MNTISASDDVLRKIYTPMDVIEYSLGSHVDISNRVKSAKPVAHIITIDVYTQKPGIDVNNFLKFHKDKNAVCICDMDIFERIILNHTKNGHLFDYVYQEVINRAPILYISNVIVPHHETHETTMQFIVCDAERIAQHHLSQMLKIAIFQGFKDVGILMHYPEDYVIDMLRNTDRDLMSYFDTVTFECNRSVLIQELFSRLIGPRRQDKKCTIL